MVMRAMLPTHGRVTSGNMRLGEQNSIESNSQHSSMQVSTHGALTETASVTTSNAHLCVARTCLGQSHRPVDAPRERHVVSVVRVFVDSLCLRAHARTLSVYARTVCLSH